MTLLNHKQQPYNKFDIPQLCLVKKRLCSSSTLYQPWWSLVATASWYGGRFSAEATASGLKFRFNAQKLKMHVTAGCLFTSSAEQTEIQNLYSLTF